MNLRQELEKIHGRKLYDDAVAKITLSYRVANGIDGRITKESDKAAILEIERAKLNQQTALSEPPTTKTRNKVKRDARYSAFTRISFNVTGNTQRQHISLEPEYMKALELIAGNDRLKWLADTVADYIAKNGIESTTRIVKASIVNALIERVKK